MPKLAYLHISKGGCNLEEKDWSLFQFKYIKLDYMYIMYSMYMTCVGYICLCSVLALLVHACPCKPYSSLAELTIVICILLPKGVVHSNIPIQLSIILNLFLSQTFSSFLAYRDSGTIWWRWLHFSQIHQANSFCRMYTGNCYMIELFNSLSTFDYFPGKLGTGPFIHRKLILLTYMYTNVNCLLSM